MQIYGRSTTPVYVKYPGSKHSDDKSKEESKSGEKICKILFDEKDKPDIGWWWRDTKLKQWRPFAIISVTGGAAKISEPDLQILPQIAFGIVSTAKNLKALIVDGGSKDGIMKAIGKAVEEDGNNVATLGIFPWNGLSKVDRTDIEETQGFSEADQNERDKPEGSSRSNKLDPNHRFFALIENKNREGGWEQSEIEDRFYIEKYLRFGGSKEKKDPLPHVLVVVNGGPGTLKTVEVFTDTQEKEDAVPILLVNGSGRAADLLAKAYEIYKKTPNQDVRDFKSEFMKLQGFDEFFKNGDCAQQCYTICKNKSGITILNIQTALNSNQNPEKTVNQIVHNQIADSLGRSIMEAICRGIESMESGDQEAAKKVMKLLIGWDSFDAVKLMEKKYLKKRDQNLKNLNLLKEAYAFALLNSSVIFTEMLGRYVRLALKEFRELLYKGLFKEFKENRDDFEKWKGLHEDRYTRNGRSKDERNDLEWHNLETKAEGGKNEEEKKASIKEFINNILWGYFRLSLLNLDSIVNGEGWQSNNNGDFARSEDIFLWSLISGREELAWHFWRRCNQGARHSISRALFASFIIKKSRFYGLLRAPGEHDGGVGGKKRDYAVLFESAALGVLDLCYQSHPGLAASLVTAPWVNDIGSSWFPVDGRAPGLHRFRASGLPPNGSCTGNKIALLAPKFALLHPMLLAFDLQAVNFVAHPAVQKSIDRAWHGRIAVEDDLDDDRPMGFRVSVLPLNIRPLRWAGSDRDRIWMKLLTLRLVLTIFSSAILVPFTCSINDAKLELKSDRESNADAPDCCTCLHKVVESALKKVGGFYHAPCIKYWLDVLSYLTFCIIFTLVGLNMAYEYTVMEGIVYAYIACLVLRELREYIREPKRYIVLGSNTGFDLVTLVVFCVAAGLRINERSAYSKQEFLGLGGLDGGYDQTRNVSGALSNFGGRPSDWARARSWYGIAGIFFWMRVLDYFRASIVMGPLVVVMTKVAWQAVLFFCLLLVFIVAFGVAIICSGRAYADPAADVSSELALAIFYPYIAIFGEHFMTQDNLATHNNPVTCSDENSGFYCSSKQSLGITLFCMYLFISAIVLMNLLIASESTQARLDSQDRRTHTTHKLYCRSMTESASNGGTLTALRHLAQRARRICTPGVSRHHQTRFKACGYVKGWAKFRVPKDLVRGYLRSRGEACGCVALAWTARP